MFAALALSLDTTQDIDDDVFPLKNTIFSCDILEQLKRSFSWQKKLFNFTMCYSNSLELCSKVLHKNIFWRNQLIEHGFWQNQLFTDVFARSRNRYKSSCDLIHKWIFWIVWSSQLIVNLNIEFLHVFVCKDKLRIASRGGRVIATWKCQMVHSYNYCCR